MRADRFARRHVASWDVCAGRQWDTGGADSGTETPWRSRCRCVAFNVILVGLAVSPLGPSKNDRGDKHVNLKARLLAGAGALALVGGITAVAIPASAGPTVTTVSHCTGFEGVA